MPTEEAVRIAHEAVEAQLPWWWSGQRRERFMRDVRLYAKEYAQMQVERLHTPAGEIGTSLR